jgi:DNA-binding XRE family transcriptional regulator
LWRDYDPWPVRLNLGNTKHLGNVAFLVPGVGVTLKATKPEFRCAQGDPLPTQLRGQRRRLNLSVEEAAAIVGVRRWTFGLWENGQQRPQARYRDAITLFLKRARRGP